MKTYKIEPLEGISFIKLGISRSEIEKLAKDNIDKFFKVPKDKAINNSTFKIGYIQIFFNNDKVEYIEISNPNQYSMDKEFEIYFEEINIFKTPVDELIKIISKKYSYSKDDPELGFSYIFPKIEMSLWREDDENEFFDTVGIGIKGYYSNKYQV